MKHLCLVLVSLVAVVTSASGPEAVMAAGPQVIGQVAPANDVNGHCACTRFQRTSAGSPATSYTIPFNGVLTKSRVWIGAETQPADWVQARTFRATGASTAKVISEGSQHFINGLPLSQPNAFYDRIPATVGDLLGARFAVNAFVEETPAFYSTASSADTMSYGTTEENPPLGGSFSTGDVTKKRVNVEAVVEPDEDGDGYGDTSQDLCPGSPIAIVACSGTLFGSDLQGGHSTPPLPCNCLRVQTTLAGSSTAAPVDGVVVRWRVLDGGTGTYRARVLEFDPTGSGGGFTKYKVLRSSAPGSVTAPAQPLISQISTFETRLPIPAGGYVGLSTPSLTEGFQASAGTATYVQTEDSNIEGIKVVGMNHNGTVLYDADIEPDADHDGYGDITQDRCPTDGSTQGACPPASQPAAPVISDFRAVPAKFRVRKGGPVISRRRAHLGTTLKLSLAEPASVTFRVERSAPCGKRGKRCARWVFVHSFKRDLPQGPSSLPYSGRFRRGGRAGSLPPGSYRIGAAPTGATGQAGATAGTRFTVLP